MSVASDDAPRFCPSQRELDDLELLLNGALAPLTGFTDGRGLITLHVPPIVTAGRMLVLTDPEGAPLARVSVESTYPAGDLVGVTGPVRGLARPEYGPFRRLHLAPATVAGLGRDLVTVPVTGPMTDRDLADVGRFAAGLPVVLLALVGEGTRTGPAGRPPLSRTGLLRATLAAGSILGAEVVAVPLAARGDADADRTLRIHVVGAYAPGAVFAVTGLGALPEPIARVVADDRPPVGRGGLVIFLTGLSGSGKSTVARALSEALVEADGRPVTVLDGDVVRRVLGAGLSFSRADRDAQVRRIGWVAAEVARHRGVAVVSLIAPFAAARREVRDMVAGVGGEFVLVHVATPLAECEARDRKGLYARARRGEIPEFTGISAPYEAPHDAEVTLDTTGRPIDDMVATVCVLLADRGLIAV